MATNSDVTYDIITTAHKAGILHDTLLAMNYRSIREARRKGRIEGLEAGYRAGFRDGFVDRSFYDLQEGEMPTGREWPPAPPEAMYDDANNVPN